MSNKNILIGLILAISATVAVVLYITPGEQRIPEKTEKTQAPVSVENAAQNIKSPGRYIDYTKASFDESSGKKRVYFFHAKWCPTCKVANEEFISMQDKIPQDVVLLKTDYDTQLELKRKFRITYQHTFVLVDENGNEIRQWNGGGINDLIKNTQ